MNRTTYNPTKLFTIEEANACLPLVRMIVSDMVSLSNDLVERRRRLDKVTGGREIDGGDPYADELAQIEQELAKDEERIKEFVNEITELGAETKSISEGLIDFPAMLGGRLAYLCWKYNEPEVLFWHELDSGFAGRQPLAVVSHTGETGEVDDAVDG